MVPPDRHLALVGLMGAGKTTVGQLLAARLGRPFLDSDAQVEARQGRTVREIWQAEGEAAYRVLETEALLAALATPEPIVLAAAGGVVLAERNRSALREQARVVWLRADPAVLVERAARGDHRPLLDQDPAGTLARMAHDRDALYREVADEVVDVAERTPEQVVQAVLGR